MAKFMFFLCLTVSILIYDIWKLLVAMLNLEVSLHDRDCLAIGPKDKTRPIADGFACHLTALTKTIIF